jgi:acyl-coenzyme A synthetase/AMP-(fatty) acid ligase
VTTASFAALIEQNSRAAEKSENILADDVYTFRLREIPQLLDEIDARLSQAGASVDSCVAVECNNSAPSALLALALMRAGRSFILAPHSATENDLKPVPRFCSHRIVVSSPPDATVPAANCLRIEANPPYNGRPAGKENLYLRTSGSMGVSKIVVHSHAGMIGNAGNCVEKYGFTAESRVSIPVPLAHMYGFGADFLPAVIAGSSIDLQDKTNVVRYLDHERRFRPDIVFATPSLCEMLLTAFRKPRTQYQAFVTSGQRISEELFRNFDRAVGGRLINQYGSTEMGATAACDFGDPLDRRATEIGRPMGGVELRLEPRSDDISTVGNELYCRHPWGYEGYLDEDGEWIAKAAADGWYRTGDIAVKTASGSMTVTGRADASVNRSGYLVMLSDIERMVERLDGVGEVAVVAGSKETERGQSIAAFCVLRSGVVLDGTEVRRRCSGLIPPYAIPDEVRIVGELPLLASGKLNRRALEALAG